MKPSQRNYWKIALAAAAVIAMGYLLLPFLRSALKIVPLARHAQWAWMFAALICQILMYGCVAQILRISLAPIHPKLPFIRLYLPAVVFLFANRAVPGPAVAGLASLVYLLGRQNVRSSEAQVSAGSFYLADYASFMVVVVFAGTSIIHDINRTPGSVWPYVTAVGIIVLFCVLGIVVYLQGEHLIALCVRLAQKLETKFGRSRKTSVSAKIQGLLMGLYSQSRLLLAVPSVLASLIGAGVLMHLLEVLTLVCAARGFHAHLAYGAAASGYVAGNLAAIVSFLPGGVGLYDGAMIAVLHTVGNLELPTAGATTIVYRLLSLAVPFPFAMHVIHRALSEQTAPASP